ncbi:site-specific DNA recombinase [Paenibacillus sp. PastF-3]|uniref:recombinase family protein n=1 Tax=Paenibacillus sp. PastF-3 TaxID=2940626 RepID=UPI002475099D|nr:recombinase family protein [Paenibacillus sp. PastF-3]MDH6373584.1 site-specific DNA recombinase [Paenibacillus sp. PastF-3]
MTVAIYIRVSTDEQAEQGYSIDFQKEKLIHYCKSQGWDDYKLYIDDGYTGTNMDRPALKRMLRNIEDKKVTAVLVYKLDRLSRKQRDILELIEDKFESFGASFTSSVEKIDTSTAFGKAMLGVLAVFAQLDRDMIIERTTAGRRQRVSTGKWYGGRVPFGYNWNKELQLLEVIPEEARVIQEIYNLYLNGHSRLSIAEWAAPRAPSRTIDHAVVREILCRQIYTGNIGYVGNIYDGTHDAIITQDIWDAVQIEIEKRKEGMTPIGEYLLTGLLKCGVCGVNIVHVRRKSKHADKEYIYELYACKDQHVRPKERTKKEGCKMGYIRRDVVEKSVIDQIKAIAINPNRLLEKSKKKKSEIISFNEQYSLLTEQLKKVNTNLENLYDAIQNGDIKASAVSNRIKSLEEQRDILEEDIDDLIDVNPKKTDEKKTLIMFQQIGHAWDHFTEDEKKIAIRKLIKSISLVKGQPPQIEWLI